MTDNATNKTVEMPKEDTHVPEPTTVAASADVVDVPDPDEDDLDDLDGTQPYLTNSVSDMLEDFSALKTESKKPDVPSGPGRPASAAGAAEKQPDAKDTTLDDFMSDDDFAKQLQDGMAEMLGNLGRDNDPAAMKDEFEKIFGAIAAAAGADDLPPPSASTPAPAPASASASTSAAPPTFGNPKDADFQETIRRTMERMHASGEQATAAATEAGSDDFMADLLKAMQAGGEEGGSEEDFSKLLLGMMEQLTNKDILYEPMKELNDKFPAWMEKNKDKVSAEDLKRYEEQQALAKEIVAKFEEPTFSDVNAKDREYIVDRMQKMQAAGSPPPDLVGDMPSAQDAFNGMNPPGDEACNPQ
ncbi:Pex19-domain-containing protein [Coniochaeta ligniaria NRRL 30616]|uniref:Pex19-domain-containing protein n=1 Tax=Coniochaeta ligniaria NRRL 30616 TaxID=1408157 RepID=A0A1J7INR0_9PEZI|nr:Pex19-domain-containing protein [Coniochaeta ligniaria NRRL 30616]